MITYCIYTQYMILHTYIHTYVCTLTGEEKKNVSIMIFISNIVLMKEKRETERERRRDGKKGRKKN
jgi:hypothetical protein